MSKFYLVGGAVRDRLLGEEIKDLDYAVEATSFKEMREAVIQRGGKIFMENPGFFTIRANVPKLGIADYVLCRKEGKYLDGRHPEKVEAGTLYDDLLRRDFTVNAMAEDEDGNIIDYFGGKTDLENKILKTVGKAEDRFREDYLRVLRAVRFAITKGFTLSDEIENCLRDYETVEGLNKVSIERIREELLKCFSYNTSHTLHMLFKFPFLLNIFGGSLWLKPTLEQ